MQGPLTSSDWPPRNETRSERRQRSRVRLLRSCDALHPNLEDRESVFPRPALPQHRLEVPCPTDGASSRIAAVDRSCARPRVAVRLKNVDEVPR
eukprot:scaffold685_cov281-Pinguiococcus_pyrenoidosus.AAC.11